MAMPGCTIIKAVTVIYTAAGRGCNKYSADVFRCVGTVGLGCILEWQRVPESRSKRTRSARITEYYLDEMEPRAAPVRQVVPPERTQLRKFPPGLRIPR